MATSLVGTVLDGKFQIEKALASGASGDVYEAIHLGLGSSVAVKVLRPGLPQTAHIRRKRFMREARVAARIQSDHVVRVFDIVAPERGLIYIVMELLLGETLGDRIRRVGAMPPLEAVGYMLQAAKPLAAMHGAGIVHRDVKPSNIFLARDAEGNERVKLLDFGVAALQQPVARGESAITFTDALVGTPRYMAPEQVLASKDVDARADVWALGVTLYELLAGRQPFDGQTVLAVLNQIESQQPPSLIELRPGIPPELAKLVHRCLAKDPALRPQDARALGEALAPFGGEVFRGEAVPRQPSDPLDLSLSDDNVEIVRERASLLDRVVLRRKWLVASGLALVALVTVSLVFAAMRRPVVAQPAGPVIDSARASVARPATDTPSTAASGADPGSPASALATVTMEPSRDPSTARHATPPTPRAAPAPNDDPGSRPRARPRVKSLPPAPPPMTTTGSNSWLLAALLLAFPVAARADATPPAPTPEQVEAAKAQYHEARELHRQGKLKEALEHALAAYRTASTPVTALEATQLLIESGQLVEARDIARSVALFPPSPRESDKGRDARQEAATLAGTLDSRIPKIAIAGRPAGVDVVLDGKPFGGNDPTAWQGLDPGAHSLTVRAGERVCSTINVILAEAEARTIDLHDVAISCGIEPAPAPVVEVPAPTAAPAALPPTLTPASSEPTSRDDERRAFRIAGIAVASAGVVAITIGGVVALAAKSSYDSVAGDCPARGCTASAFDVRQSARSRGDAATVTMVAGAAVLTGGVILFALAPAARDGVRVGIGPGSARLVVSFE